MKRILIALCALAAGSAFAAKDKLYVDGTAQNRPFGFSKDNNITCPYRSTFTLSYDATALRLVIDFDYPHMERLAKQQSSVWNEPDFVELWLDPSGVGTNMFHIAISAFDFGWAGTVNPCKHTVVSERTATGWKSTFTVRFADLGVKTPAVGDRWLGNVCRDYLDDRGARVYSTWGRIGEVFKNAERMPYLYFGSERQVREVEAARAKATRAKLAEAVALMKLEKRFAAKFAAFDRTGNARLLDEIEDEIIFLKELKDVKADASVGCAAAPAGFDLRAFANPAPEFSPGFFWMWNDVLDEGILCRQLEDMAAHGVKSVCIHPVPRNFRASKFPSWMEPDYLTPEFLSVYKKVVSRAHELGMSSWLYDEGGWPSGGACGQVLAGDKTGAFRMRRLVPQPDGSCTVEVLKPSDPKASAPYPSIVEKGVTERFLELTHEAYYARMPELFGNTIRFAFTDEPDFVRGVTGQSFGWTSDFDAEFRARKGYDFRPLARAALTPAADDERAIQARIDYYDVMTDLLCERYLLPIRGWCRDHGIQSGGHMNCEHRPEWTSSVGYGSILRALGAMDVPGVDVIWRQLFPDTRDADRPFPRYASSAMHQNGGKYALSESFGIFGDGLTPDQMRWVVNFQLLRGINLFVFGYYPMGTDGRWLTLFEPHFGPSSPVWDFSEPLYRETARTAALLAQGRPGAETLVLYDVRAMWANRAEAEYAAGAQLAAARALERRCCDYDFAEDRAIAAATVEKGALKVGAMRYRTVVLPTTRRMLPAARQKLEEFRRAGGRVLTGEEVALAPATCRIDGIGADAVRVMKRVAGDEALYFLFNEGAWSTEAVITLNEKGTVVRLDPATGEVLPLAREKDGSVALKFRAYETALLLVLPRGWGSAAERPKAVGKPARLELAWTVQAKTRFAVKNDEFVRFAAAEAARATKLGDWRDALGEDFCGTAVYRATVERPADGVCELDLGSVRYAASLRVNGMPYGSRFGAPFVWRVNLKKGRNDLEVTVAGLLANALTEEVRADARRRWPEAYDEKQASFDRQNLGGGLFGPVQLTPQTK